MVERKVIGTKELATILGYKPISIRAKRYRINKGLEPENALPPTLDKPGHPKWLISDVEAWLNNSAAAKQQK